MMAYKIRAATSCDLNDIVDLSKRWEDEQITYGVVASNIEDYENTEVWVCCNNDTIIGYLCGKVYYRENKCIFPSLSDYFEIEEFYIDAPNRSQGIGSKLYYFVESELKKKGISCILLSSATKDSMRIIDYYNSLGFSIWNTTFYKKF